MAALLTYESAARKIEDWAPYIGDCLRTVFPDHTTSNKHVGFKVGLPDINQSDALFSVVFDEGEEKTNLGGHIRFGLSAVKGAGTVAVTSIVEARDEDGPFQSIFDFCARMSKRTVNRATIEALVKGGAFDHVHGVDNRAAILAVLDKAIAAGASAARDQESGQSGLFVGEGEESSERTPQWTLPKVTPWTQPETLNHEKSVLGIHVSGHPLDQHDDQLRSWCSDNITELKEIPDGRRVVVGGLLSTVDIRIVRRGSSSGEKMAILILQDRVGKIDCVIYSDAYQKFSHLLQQDNIVIVVGRIDRSRGELQLKVDSVTSLQDASLYLAKRIEITFHNSSHDGATKGKMELVSGLIRQAEAARVIAGTTPAEVIVHINTGDHVATVRSDRKVVIEPKLIHQIIEVMGQENVRLVSISGG
jgi:DNA polymerase-3 subunit alpha